MPKKLNFVRKKINLVPKNVQFSAGKNQINAEEIKNSVKKTQELTNGVNRKCSNRVCLRRDYHVRGHCTRSYVVLWRSAIF